MINAQASTEALATATVAVATTADTVTPANTATSSLAGTLEPSPEPTKNYVSDRRHAIVRQDAAALNFQTGELNEMAKERVEANATSASGAANKRRSACDTPAN